MNISDSQLKILHLIMSLTPTNGQYNEHCLPLVNKRAISICTYYKSKIKPPEEIALFDGDDTAPGFFRALKAALDSKEYDVIHAHLPLTGVLLLIALIFYRRYKKVRPYTVYTVQNSYQNYKFWNRLMLIPIIPFYRKLVFCSQACLDSFPTYLKWLGGDKIQVVQNAVDLERVDQTIAGMGKSNHNDHFTIASVGRIIKIKNPLALLKAFHQGSLQTGRLVFIGEGNLRSQIAQEVDRLGLQNRVILTGLIGRDAVFRYTAQADLFVSTSRGEGLPVAVIEAMACRRPVVLSDIPPHREIAEGVNFIPLLDPDDVAGFACEIKRFIELTSVERAAIGEKCRNLVEKKFSLTIMHDKLDKIYAQLPRDNYYWPKEQGEVA